MNSMGTHLHKTELHSFHIHLKQIIVNGQGIGSGMACFIFFFIYQYFNGRDKSYFISSFFEQIVEQRRYGGLSIGSRYPDQF